MNAIHFVIMNTFKNVFCFTEGFEFKNISSGEKNMIELLRFAYGCILSH